MHAVAMCAALLFSSADFFDTGILIVRKTNHAANQQHGQYLLVQLVQYAAPQMALQCCILHM